jgi:hypothetical protein
VILVFWYDGEGYEVTFSIMNAGWKVNRQLEGFTGETYEQPWDHTWLTVGELSLEEIMRRPTEGRVQYTNRTSEEFGSGMLLQDAKTVCAECRKVQPDGANW